MNKEQIEERIERLIKTLDILYYENQSILEEIKELEGEIKELEGEIIINN